MKKSNTVRKRKSRKNETPEHYDMRLAKLHEEYQQKRQKSLQPLQSQQPQQNLLQQELQQNLSQQEPQQDCVENGQDLNKFDQSLLKKFRIKVDKFKYSFCPICNECFPSIVLTKGEYCHFFSEKTFPKKFSVENNMDPGEVPEELQELTEIEEMLIAQFFP
jgi:uncharacterized protein DUF6570